MISAKKLLKLARKWQKAAAIWPRRIELPQAMGNTDTTNCSTSPISKKGHFVVYSADQKRFLLPLKYVNNEIIRELFNMAEEEFALSTTSTMDRHTLPCDAEFAESEAKLIRIIANKVLRKLSKASPSVNKQLVQLNSKVKELNLQLCEEWEKGNIKFCGLKWSRRIWPDSAMETNLKKKRLQNKQVDVIVNEVEKLEQLVYFAGEQDWFGPGSRVIISFGDPIKNNMKVLHVNFQGPTNRDKKIFLDIVCFFEGRNNIENAMRTWNKLLLGSGLLVNVGMKVHMDEFTISDDDNLLLHEHRTLNILEINYEVSPEKTKPSRAASKMEGTTPKEDFPQQEIEKEEEVHNEAAMAKPAVAAMELPARAEEDKEEAKPLSNGPKAPTVPSGNEISGYRPSPESLQQQKQTLEKYLNMSLEAIHKAEAFNDIEKIVSTLTHHSANLYEKASLLKLMHRLAEFKGSVPGSMAIAKSTQAQRTSLFKKSRKLNNSLAQQQEKLRSTEAELSKISKEEEELEIKIQNLISRKEKLLEHKKFTALQLENTNKMVSNNLAEQKELEGEIKQTNENWYKAKEKLALANAIWKLFKECIEL
ncbi:hypothetical protein GH714_008534 [Hevea brasiliensis]|uniref:Disease resistance protein Roq1-like winged-helix domain-containing protein n=1 Tax=Hevea brasiliensis TaxID=3981 RepID=A0A6A6L271_HEVBR|nr:hypothetical protein GH714_008534 [Hevea brasiliensis]